MTGYTVHTGSTEKFATGWDQVFRKGKSAKKRSVKGAKRMTVRAKASAKAAPRGKKAGVRAKKKK